MTILTVSISFRKSKRVLLSLISPEAIQLLIWSRNLWSFLISFLRSASYFSFWLLFVALWTFFQISSNVSTPSVTFLRHLSISPEIPIYLIKKHSKQFNKIKEKMTVKKICHSQLVYIVAQPKRRTKYRPERNWNTISYKSQSTRATEKEMRVSTNKGPIGKTMHTSLSTVQK